MRDKLGSELTLTAGTRMKSMTVTRQNSETRGINLMKEIWDEGGCVKIAEEIEVNRCENRGRNGVEQM